MIKGREHTSYFKITSILQKYIVSLLTEKEILENYIQEISETARVQKNISISKYRRVLNKS